MTWGRGGGQLCNRWGEFSALPLGGAPPQLGSVCAPGLEGVRIQPSVLPGLNVGAPTAPPPNFAIHPPPQALDPPPAKLSLPSAYPQLGQPLSLGGGGAGGRGRSQAPPTC